MEPLQGTGKNAQKQNWMAVILTDVHFWVPVAVLLGGLLLLRFIR